jgi:DNA-binding winged helix-turn-helix (wHTH) protein
MPSAAHGVYEFGSYRLDLARRLLLRDSKRVRLKPKPLEALVFLVENHGRLLTKEEMMQALWPETTVEENNLTQCISALRRVFGEARSDDEFIVTVPGRGYRFVADVRRLDQADAEDSSRIGADNGVAYANGSAPTVVRPAVLAHRVGLFPSLQQPRWYLAIGAGLIVVGASIAIAIIVRSDSNRPQDLAGSAVEARAQGDDTASREISLPLTVAADNKMDLGAFDGGEVLSIVASGRGDLVDARWQVFPDGSVAAQAGDPYSFSNAGAAYPMTFGGDGTNHFPGGGANLVPPSSFGFAGALTTDTRHPNAIRVGAVVGTFSSTPTRDDWFSIGRGTQVTVPAGGAHLYVAVNDVHSGDNHGFFTLAAPMPSDRPFLLPLTVGAVNKLTFGMFEGGQVVSISVSGQGDLVDPRWQVFPDGSLVEAATGVYSFANFGAPYATTYGGDGINYFPGGGANIDWKQDVNEVIFGFAGEQITNTTGPNAIRFGAVVGTFASQPTRADWFLIGRGTTLTIPAGGAHLYVAVNDSWMPDNHGVFTIVAAQPRTDRRRDQRTTGKR